MEPAKEYLAEITKLTPLTKDVVELEIMFIAPAAPSYIPGQFMEFLIDGQCREYSIISPRLGNNERIQFCIKQHAGGLTEKWLESLLPGHELRLRGPYGNFFPNPNDMNRDWLCVATGVGIAPFCSIIADALHHGYRNQVTLLFGLHSEDNVFYYHKFQEMASVYPNFHFIPMLSHPAAHWPGEVGRVTTYIENNYRYFVDPVCFLCGNADAVQAARKALLAFGHASRDIRTELFS